MQFMFDGMAQALAISAFVPKLDDFDSCRQHLRRMAWATDRLDDGIMRVIVARAKEYREQANRGDPKWRSKQ